MKFLVISIIPLLLAACTTPDGLVTMTERSATVEPEEHSVDVHQLDLTAQVRVSTFIPDYFPAAGVLRDEYDETRQFVLLDLSISNTGAESFPLNPASFSLRSNEAVFEQTPVINSGHRDDLLAEVSIPPGDSVSGTVVFEIPDDANELILQYEGFTTEPVTYDIRLR
ncbi:MAG: Telomeric repeat-binding factor 2 [candidate division WS6 bacterium OLB20]|uniref:Telomeric repeat-binding factor 2 n=1 Tax=candidate division WS6 bacterium OLB20 TaxID=1617426 RepID=A0A136LXZ2_9BACT|nr:MAG: Telomeric repeat-binding factor 2 [candidate division WS6 bacterium OLB20]